MDVNTLKLQLTVSTLTLHFWFYFKASNDGTQSYYISHPFQPHPQSTNGAIVAAGFQHKYTDGAFSS